MTEIGVGIVGGGYMGKAHAVAMSAVGAVFETRLRPRLEMVCATGPQSAERYRSAYGFRRSTTNWQALVDDPMVEAVIIASPQQTHRDIALAAIAAGKPVLCEKPMGVSLDEARAMTEAAEASGVANMVGYNYIRTPASQFARALIAGGEIGDIVWYRGEHTEDFLADPDTPANWRTRDWASGNTGDLAPHPINAALALAGPIEAVNGFWQTVVKQRPGEAGPEKVLNDDQSQMMIRFANGAMGHIFSSRVSHGRKMGYAYEITCTKGAIRFDQEDQNAIWLYRAAGPQATRGFVKILAGPAHPDFLSFCQGPGHGTGYQDQIIIEARDFLAAIESGKPVWPTFRDGLEVLRVSAACSRSHETGRWQDISDF
ncbi:MAG: Gfo/Idh/MocA family oxidoreductase [Rhizobiaceae bacterium]